MKVGRKSCLHELLVTNLGGNHGEGLGWNAGHHGHNEDHIDDHMMIIMMTCIDLMMLQEYWESRGTESDPWYECGSTEVSPSHLIII